VFSEMIFVVSSRYYWFGMQIEKTWEIATVVSPSNPTPSSVALPDSLAVCESHSSRSQVRRLVLATNLAAC
jgi:hypothetical protein